jgi:ABC-type phosphate/phosphonate transport system substrate-binding protein
VTNRLVLGAVAYDAKVVDIWNGFRSWLRERGVSLDFLLYANYEHQVEDLLAGRLDLAWNSPLAWIRADRMARARGVTLHPVAMRDTDRDLTSVVVVRADSGIQTPADLRGRLVATGAIDSPQATLIPLSCLRAAGLTPGTDLRVRRFDVGVGLHGDHIGGEREAVKALSAGQVEAACLVDANLLLFARDGTLPANSVRTLLRSRRYDHCTLTASADAPTGHLDKFVEALLGMEYADPQARRLLDLEGLKQWLPARTDRYDVLRTAVDESGFYDAEGSIGAPDYRP